MRLKGLGSQPGASARGVATPAGTSGKPVKFPSLGTAASTTNASESAPLPAFKLPDGFNGDMAAEGDKVTLQNVAEIFQAERAQIARNQAEKQALYERIALLEVQQEALEKDVQQRQRAITQRDEKLGALQSELAETQRTLQTTEKQYLDTRLRLQDVQEQFGRLDGQAKDFSLVRDQRDALVRALETANKEKRQLVDKLADERQDAVARDTRASTRIFGGLGGRKAAQGGSSEKGLEKNAKATAPSNQRLCSDAADLVASDPVLQLPPAQGEVANTAVIPLQTVAAKVERGANSPESTYQAQCALIHHEKSHVGRLGVSELQDGYTNALGRLREREEKILELQRALAAKPNEVIVLTPETPTQLAARKRELEGLTSERDEAQRQVQDANARAQLSAQRLFDAQERHAETQKQLNAATAQCTELRTQLANAKTAAEKAQAVSAQQLEQAVAQGRLRLEETQRVLANLQGQYAQVHDEYRSLVQTSQNDAANRGAEAETAASAAAGRVADLERQIAELRAQQKRSDADHEKMQKLAIEGTQTLAVNKTLTAGLAKLTAERAAVQLELDRVQSEFSRERARTSSELTQLEAFVFSLKQTIARFLETAAEPGDVEGEGPSGGAADDGERHIQQQLRRADEALTINQAFIDKAAKDRDTARVKQLTLERDALQAQRRRLEDALVAILEKRRGHDALLAELQALRQFKTQYSGLAASVTKAHQASKLVLVTPQGIVVTTMGDLKAELGRVGQKRELADLSIPLPTGWRRLQDPDGRMFYLQDGSAGKCQWVHPSSKHQAVE